MQLRTADEEISDDDVDYKAGVEFRKRSEIFGDMIRDRGSRYKDCTIANYVVANEKQKAVVDAILEYGKSLADRVAAGEGLLLIGTAGTGKDHLVAALLRHAVFSGGLTVKWQAGPDIWATFRDAIGSETNEKSVVEKYTWPKLLAISDPALRGQPLTNFQADVLYRIVDRRYSERKPTIATANVKDRKELESLVGAATVDRLTESATVLACDWPSYRKPLAVKEHP